LLTTIVFDDTGYSIVTCYLISTGLSARHRLTTHQLYRDARAVIATHRAAIYDVHQLTRRIAAIYRSDQRHLTAVA
jgi:hypothetical protein